MKKIKVFKKGKVIDNQQGPTYGTRNSTQYSVITHMGKESEKGWTYVYA